MFSNLKFIDGEIIPEWQEPFATIANANLTKQKSQELPEISDLNSKWLQTLEDVKKAFMENEERFLVVL